MQYLTKATEFLSSTSKMMGALLGLSVFAELIFGKFLGDYSVITNMIDIVAKFGNNGFVGLLAMLLIIGYFNK